jgi:nucleotide-binding universal stress UspA family protein
MFNKILVPTDGSELSEKAVVGAARFARQLGASLVVLTVTEPYSYSNLSEYRPESIDGYDARMLALANERLARAAQIAEAEGVKCEPVLVRSFSPFEAIISATKEQGCDVVFMASHGRKGLAAVLLGSETQKVLTHSTVPVMVYR